MTRPNDTAGNGHYARAALLLMAAFTAYRLALAWWLPLIADEAYGVAVSRYPTLSYFDHPPLAFGFARAAAWLFGSEAEFVVRLPHVALGTLTSWLLFLVTRRAFASSAAGFWAVGAYTVAPFFLASAGTFVVPDGPLNVFALTALWLALPALSGERSLPAWRWALAGLAFGLALLSKYTAFLFGASVLALLLAAPAGRRELGRPGPWLAGLTALACLAPVLIWNWQNGWASFGFQSNRAVTGGLNPLNFVLIQLGQAAYILPWTWGAALLLLVRGITASDARRVFSVMAAPPIIIFGIVGLFTSEPLSHWAMPGFLFAFPLIGHWCATALSAWPRLRRGALAGSAALTCLLGLAVAWQTSTAGFTRAIGVDVERDFDWTFLSWDALKRDFEARGILSDEQAFIVSTSWNTAGKSAHAVGPSIPAAPPLSEARHFAHGTDPRLAGRTRGYLVEATWPADVEPTLARLRESAAARFMESGEPWTVVQERGGTPAFAIIVLPVTPR